MHLKKCFSYINAVVLGQMNFHLVFKLNSVPCLLSFRWLTSEFYSRQLYFGCRYIIM